MNPNALSAMVAACEAGDVDGVLRIVRWWSDMTSDEETADEEQVDALEQGQDEEPEAGTVTCIEVPAEQFDFPVLEKFEGAKVRALTSAHEGVMGQEAESRQAMRAKA